MCLLMREESKSFPINKETDMTSIADSAVMIQTSSQSVPCPPPWFGEVGVMAEYLRKLGIIDAISEHVCFARGRAGHYPRDAQRADR